MNKENIEEQLDKFQLIVYRSGYNQALKDLMKIINKHYKFENHKLKQICKCDDCKLIREIEACITT